MTGKIAQHRGHASASIAAQSQARKRLSPASALEHSAGLSSSAVEVAIISDGKIGLAMGASLAIGGHNVRLWMPNGKPPHQCAIVGRGQLAGQGGHALRFKQVDKDLASLAKGAEVLVVCGRTALYGAIVDELAAVLSSGQTIVLPDAPLCAAFQFAGQLERAAADAQVNIVEMGSLFETVRIEGDSLFISAPREKVSICGRTRNETRRVLAAVSRLWGGLVPASNVLERGFADVQRLINPVLALFNALQFQSGQAFTSPIASPALVSVVSRMADEVQALAAGCSVGFSGVEQILRDYAGLKVASLGQALLEMGQDLFANQAARGDSTLDTMEMLAADVAETHVPLSALAMVARVRVPMIDSLIELASCVTHRELRKEGRGLDHLGLVGLDVAEIVETVNL
jgi:opine dehydrogenase